jgi:acetamidase/formamidase
MGHTYELDASVRHFCWDNSIAPRLEIEPGDSVLFETFDASDGGVQRDGSYNHPTGGAPGHALTGPVYIKGAEPGDTLVVEVLEVKTGEWGWTRFQPGRGLLPDDFKEPFINIWDLSKGREWTEFVPGSGIYVPLEPFCGVMGLALPEAGQHSTVPPRRFGGNLDIKQLNKGARLFLPVGVEGGLFSTGDCHASQGDGEVCITAIETMGHPLFKFDLIKGQNLKTPRVWTGKQASSIAGRDGYFITTAQNNDLLEASRDAIRYMIDYLEEEYKLTREQAYILCSVVVDLKISEVVNAPNWVVSAFLPNAIFQKKD